MKCCRQIPFWILLLTAITTLPAGAQEAETGLAQDVVVLPGGTFRQGSPQEEQGRRDNEGPVREVKVAPFALGRFEVTVGDFRSFAERTGYRTDADRNVPIGGQPAPGCWSHLQPGEPSAGWVPGRSWREPGFAQSEGHPVVCVSWVDATAYVSWLRRETGLPYRLPTESEFEYVNRAGSPGPWPWPVDAESCRYANQADASLKERFPAWRSEVANCDDGHAFSAPVGSYGSNPFGLEDMAGNVSEWSRDCWHDDYLGAPVDGSSWEPEVEADCSWRVLRGGDFVTSPVRFRSAHRTSIPPSFRTYHAGFRIAMSVRPAD